MQSTRYENDNDDDEDEASGGGGDTTFFSYSCGLSWLKTLKSVRAKQSTLGGKQRTTAK